MAGPNTNVGTLQYTGVNAPNPPNYIKMKRAPTTNDWQNVTIGDLWEDTLKTSPTFMNVWILVSISGTDGNTPQTAIWSLLSAGGGDLTALTADDGLTALPNGAGKIKIAGDRDILTNAATANQVQVTLKNAISLGDLAVIPPGTNALHVVTGDIEVSAGDINVAAGNVTVVGDGTTTGQIVAVGQANSAVATGIFIAKNRAGGVITSGDELGSYNFTGFDGTNNITASRIVATNSGTVAANRIASNLQFFTHPDSITASTQRMVIAPAGNVTINAPDSGIALTVNGTSVGVDTIKAIVGDVELTQGNIVMPNTTASTQGVYVLNGTRFMHAYATTADFNSFLGFSSGNFTMTGGSATKNSGIGAGSLSSLTTGTENSALGSQSGQFITTGNYNTFLGQQAGVNYVSNESSNIIIGDRVGGTVTESNVIRIGTSGAGIAQQSKCWIAAIRGVTTDVNDAIAVLIDSTGQLGTVSSSIRFKENVEDLGAISEDIYKLRPVIFNYINRESQSKSIGLIAEEVDAVLPSLVVKNKDGVCETVKYHDLPVLILNELQKLNKRIEALEEKLK